LEIIQDINFIDFRSFLSNNFAEKIVSSFDLETLKSIVIISLSFGCSLQKSPNDRETFVEIISQKNPTFKKMIEEIFDQKKIWNPNNHKLFSSKFQKQIETILLCVKSKLSPKLSFRVPKYILYIIFNHFVAQTIFPDPINDEKMRIVQQMIEMKNSQINKIQIQNKRNKILEENNLKKNNEEKEKEIQTLRNELENKKRKIEQTKQKNKKLKETLVEKDQRLIEKDKIIIEKDQRLVEKDKIIMKKFK
jgi:hypothetical protein